jgi:hypothetical protein
VNSADADIEAWAAIKLSDDSLAAIEEIEDESQSHSPHTSYSAGHTHTHQPDVEIELYDSGVSRHMSPYAKRFINYCSIPPHLITAANKGTFYAIGTGDLRIDVPNGKGTTPVILHDTLHAPEMALTIVSISRITNASYEATFSKRSCKIKNKSGKTIGEIPASANHLYKVEHAFTAASANQITVEHIDIHTLHRRLGHIAVDTIRALISNGAITGIRIIDDGSLIICDSCKYAKLMRKPIKSKQLAPPANRFGEEIHSDVWGPSPTNSLGG